MKKTNFGDVPIGLLLIAAFYILGAFMLLVSIFINPIGVSQTIAVVHGLSPSMGVEILLAVAALALGGRKVRHPIELQQDVKPFGDQDENKDVLDEKQAAVTEATWTILNPPSN